MWWWKNLEDRKKRKNNNTKANRVPAAIFKISSSKAISWGIASSARKFMKESSIHSNIPVKNKWFSLARKRVNVSPHAIWIIEYSESEWISVGENYE